MKLIDFLVANALIFGLFSLFLFGIVFHISDAILVGSFLLLIVGTSGIVKLLVHFFAKEE